jgi:uncharacterized membrane protein YdjX (TVP38/TMEM64 family)
LIFVLARVLGRQIAREEFERRLDRIASAGANDNEPPDGADPRREQ